LRSHQEGRVEEMFSSEKKTVGSAPNPKNIRGSFKGREVAFRGEDLEILFRPGGTVGERAANTH